MRSFAQLTFVLVLLLVSPFVMFAEPIEFIITPGTPNQVKFTSIAPLETIVGVTDQINGSLHFDPGDMTDTVMAEFSVDMTSLDTGNKTRNEHMRDNHLETDQFPVSKFVLNSLGSVSGRKLEHHVPKTFKAVGEFSLHGVTNIIEPHITAIWDKDKKSIDILAKFDLFLASYNIPRPQFLVMKLDEKQSVEISFTAMVK